jgi:diguanylate cyclase (GGDEF)-like protein/PAS domain S-box-containing protein
MPFSAVATADYAKTAINFVAKRILIVEDEIVVARDVQLLLESLGYTVAGVTPLGEEAITLAGALRPDAILMDINLAGGMDGVTAAQVIREQFGVPVIFLTAYAADEVLARAKLVEPYGYILKPFSERELKTVLEMALYKHAADVKLSKVAGLSQAIVDNIADGVITIDQQGLVTSLNSAAGRIFGYEDSQVLGHNISMLMPAPHRAHHDGYLQSYYQTGEASVLGVPREVRGLRSNGDVFPMNLFVSRLVREEKTIFIGLIRDLTEHHQDLEEIRRLAFYDALTGLPNRRLLMDRLGQAMLASTRSGEHGALILLDLDHFKRLNDTLGHDVGDELLQQVAARLRTCVREGDSVARIGGDEFVVLLESLSNQAMEAATDAELVAIKILEALAKPYELRDHLYSVTPSIGIVQFTQGQETAEDLFKMADVAMYQAKSSGRNTACFFDPAIQAAAAARTAMEKDLLKGVSGNEFVLHYQVQVDGEGHCTGVEALVRWQHAARGMVSPAHFIPLAEETGLILPLGQWVLESACAQLVLWADNPATAHWTMAVNVSASQFAQADFVDHVEAALAKTGANPSLLKLELTESMLVADIDAVIAKMNAIKQRGVAFSLDDFGTGYSSLTYLKRLPLSQLKIDQSFVRDVLTNASDAVIARTILALGHSLDMKVIAEGVETAEQHRFLSDLGCDAFQGYFFGRPVSAEELPHGSVEIHA